MATLTGSLVVIVTQHGSGRPARGVGLGVMSRGNDGLYSWVERASQPRAVTDDQGRARFEGLPARSGTVRLNRVGGDGSFGAESFTIVPGEAQTLRFTVDLWARVHGRRGPVARRG